VAVVAREREEGTALGVGEIRRQAVLEHRGEGLRLAVAGEVECHT